MKLIKFSITNYRSITKAHQINISELTVLIGKNNEGKSNILKALNVAMVSLQKHARFGRGNERAFQKTKSEEFYDWERDFPIALQSRKQGTQSIFVLEFGLDNEETEEFKNVIGSQLNGVLPITIKYGKDNKSTVDISKPGKVAKILSEKSAQIARFIAEKIYFNYIPAVRTDQEALGIIRSMLSAELNVLEEKDEYRLAFKTISDLQKPILKKLAQKIKDPLNKFLPNIKDVRIEVYENSRAMALRREVDVVIDDGFPTSIEYKGDGVKSLATLALLKNRYSPDGAATIVAIEEPESHLHPSAIHQLRDIVLELSNSNQVIVSTHNPLFVERDNIESNIIIHERTAKPAKNLKEIRELLGIQASDNLINAKYVLVVEGSEDVTSLKHLLSSLSPKISIAIKKNFLIIDEIGGASNLPYKLSMLSNALCTWHVLLDGDKSGIESFEKNAQKGLLSVKNCTFIKCKGMKEAEFEDVLDYNLYAPVIKEKYGVNLDVKEFRNSFKWSTRVESAFQSQGKHWNDNIKAEVKMVVAQCVKEQPQNALNTHKRSSIDALVLNIENMLQSPKTG